MKVLKLIEMVSSANKLATLLGDEEKYVEIVFNEHGYSHKVRTTTEYRKLVKDTINSDYIQHYIDMDVEQDEKYKSYFNGQDGFEANVIDGQ